MTEEERLAVELGEGFSGDRVTLLIDGSEVWHGTAVTTNYSVGIADVVYLAAAPRGATVEVRAGNRSAQLRLPSTPGTPDRVRFRAAIALDGTLTLDLVDEEPLL
ncbi:hypothetical protein [Haloechinothrix sp. LS1_15]|uniref:hypothetical protein n=1 Tax=Haloechinothrix sp. LS1_15 TaxID=2652248 RepID=UPI002946B81D|nr:hypothetical protein [Haloechinothrix sp. LS1_15]MDV6011744.1 hypothetical protein [Haloechinothrix sp. LS1_15]